MADKCSGLVLHFFLFSRQGAALCTALHWVQPIYIHINGLQLPIKKNYRSEPLKYKYKFQHFSSCGLIFYHSKFSHVDFSQIELSVCIYIYLCMYVCIYIWITITYKEIEDLSH